MAVFARIDEVMHGQKSVRYSTSPDPRRRQDTLKQSAAQPIESQAIGNCIVKAIDLKHG
ncbi:uncharacterized protein FTOL_10548 [Fusarium torulosum]|uniref:Uncharacterized protein n=1 Tax=Fusarium torulosum TaxID=33205 RepID=A0AAE8MIS0_9HYPO|nr:uncharacterized protein FTOL_10548 [Fusarium torulosum]